jgi:hypothetical protein
LTGGYDSLVGYKYKEIARLQAGKNIGTFPYGDVPLAFSGVS